MKKKGLNRIYPYILITLSLLGLVASFALTYDKIHILNNGSYVPSCDINPVLSCASVMNSEQSNLFGLPNTVFGLMGYTALITIGAILLLGVKLPRRVWIGLQLAVTLALAFVVYLFFQGVYRINAICPWCFLLWITTIPLFVTTTAYNLQNGNITLNKRLKKVSNIFANNYIEIILIVYLILFGLLINHFWYYWKTLI